MNRTTFLKRSIGALLFISAVPSISSCSKEEDTGGTTPTTKSCLDNGTSSSISSNHGHTLTVSKADVLAGSEKTYNIKGTSNHPHTVTITSSQFSSLQSNQSITVTSSSDDAHTHSVTVRCA
jgi:hypothetical protein